MYYFRVEISFIQTKGKVIGSVNLLRKGAVGKEARCSDFAGLFIVGRENLNDVSIKAQI